jgi:glyoxylase-like metal-dependent hydrolase (beta-lactamase superfamily II)
MAAALTVGQDQAQAQAFAPSIELEKVIGNVYVGKQRVPLTPILGTDPGTYLTVNLYVIASDDKSEVVLIDAPALPELFQPFMEALEAKLPGASIKGVLLTHDHVDHSWSIPYFFLNGIPVYASATEIFYDVTPPGPFDFPLVAFPTIPIDPGFSIELGDGATVKAVDLPGHTPGELGYAYLPERTCDKINWFFVGDMVLAPPDHGASNDPYDITHFVRMMILVQDTFSREIWEESILGLKGLLTKHAKVFPGHGAIRDGYFWQEPDDYIDFTVGVLRSF